MVSGRQEEAEKRSRKEKWSFPALSEKLSC